MKRFNPLIVGTLLVWVGCGSGTEVFVPPPDSDFASMLLVVRAEDTTIVHAVSLAKNWETNSEVPEDISVEVHAIFYSCSLSELGLAKGLQTVGNSSGGWRIEPFAKVMVSARPANGKQSDWTSVDPSDLPDWLAGLRIEAQRPSVCATFSMQEVRIPNTRTEGDPTFLVDLDEDTVLVGMSYGGLHLVERSGTVTPLSITFSSTASAGLRTSDGTIWIVTQNDCVYRMQWPDAPVFVSCSPRAPESGIIYLDGPRNGELFELFVVTESRSFERFDGTSWSTIHVEPGDRNRKSGVAYIAPGEAVAVGLLDPSTVRFEDGNKTIESLPITNYDKLVVVAQTGMGTVVGSNLGYLYVNNDNGWEDLSQPLMDVMRHIVPLSDGSVLAGGKRGFLSHVLVDGRFCPDIRFLPDDTDRFLVLGNDRFVGTSRRSSDDATVVFFDREPQITCID